MDEFVELTAVECRDLLETDVVGRVGFVLPDGPRIVPVNFVVVDDAIEFRTTAHSELARHAPGEPIVFEIDHLDSERQRGWSIVARGVCERLDALPASGPGAWADEAPGPEPWAGGLRPVRMRLAWRELSGRRVGGDHWPHPVVSGRSRRY